MEFIIVKNLSLVFEAQDRRKRIANVLRSSRKDLASNTTRSITRGMKAVGVANRRRGLKYKLKGGKGKNAPMGVVLR